MFNRIEVRSEDSFAKGANTVQSDHDNKKNPCEYKGFALRETHENSNYILLRIPVEIHLFQRGLQGICMDPDLLPRELGLAAQDIERLMQAGLVRFHPQRSRTKEYVT